MAMPITWQEGYDAAAEGKSAMDDCPYDFDTSEHKSWVAGYDCWLDEQED